ncbi:hypothetical protein HG531_003399 [Fusarium graminearum]|nr:hypothetical protein HG531_003399 [Fusarium graminearum]
MTLVSTKHRRQSLPAFAAIPDSLPLLGIAGIRASGLGFGLDILNQLVLGLILCLLVVDGLVFTTLAKLVDTSVVDANHPAGVLRVVKEVQEDDGLHKDIGQDGADRDTNIVLLLAIMGNVGSKSKGLENHMQNANHYGDTEQVRVRVQENFLDHFDFGAIATARERTAEGGLPSSLLGVGLHGGHELELPACQVVEINAKRKLLNGIVKKGHLLASGKTNIEVPPKSAIVLNSGWNGKLGLDRSLVGLVAEVELLFLEHEIFLGDGRDGNWVEGLRDVFGDLSVCEIVKDLLRSKFKGRDAFNIAGNHDGLASVGVGDGNSLLVLLHCKVHSRIETKVDGATKNELVEAEALYAKPDQYVAGDSEVCAMVCDHLHLRLRLLLAARLGHEARPVLQPWCLFLALYERYGVTDVVQWVWKRPAKHYLGTEVKVVGCCS